MLQLVDEGKVDLDEPVAPLPARATASTGGSPSGCCSTTEQPADFFFNAKIDQALQGRQGRDVDGERTWRYVPKVRPGRAQVWTYSNTNYLLLGELVEHVTTGPLAEEIRARLLDPLQLDTAWYQAAEQPRDRGRARLPADVRTDGWCAAHARRAARAT